MPRHLDFVTLDVFTADPFSGNPLAIVSLPADGSAPLSQAQKQQIAREFNYSETVFVHPVSSASPTKRSIDIFLTDRELPFAGHPVVGAATWLRLLAPLDPSRDLAQAPIDTIITKAGEIRLSIFASSASVYSGVNALIPQQAHIHKARFPLSELLKLQPSLSSTISDNDGGKTFPILSIVKGVSQIFVELPDLAALGSVSLAPSVPTTSTAQGGYLDEGWEGYGLIDIYFYVRNVWDAKVGKHVIRTRQLDAAFEDPATGSAASGLAAYLSLVDADKGGRSYDYEFIQGVEMGRRSQIGVKVLLAENRKNIESLELRGTAVKISEGRILVKEEV